MANIESVRLPNGTTYDINDANAVQVADIINNLTSTSTTAPLSANMGRVLGQASNGNLLLNPFFEVNERGWTSGTAVYQSECVSAWKMTYQNTAGTIQALSGGGLRITSGNDTGTGVYQQADYSVLDGKDITVSVCYKASGAADDTLLTHTFTSFDSTTGVSFSDESIIANYSTTFGFMVRANPNKTVDFYCVKLELGERSTLANDLAPNKTIETLKCQEADFSGVSNENLLDNGWFTVNQRGFTSGTAANGTYCVDRWLESYDNNAGTLTMSANGLRLTPAASSTLRIVQAFENGFTSLLGAPITVSVKLSDGTIHAASGVIPSPLSSTYNLTLSATLSVSFYTSGRMGVATTADVTIRAVKLERGGKSTLAHDVAPNYTAELLKCQRYFYRLKASISNAWVCIGATSGTSKFNGIINLPVPMRATPTVTYSGGLDVQEYGSGVVGHLSAVAWVFRIDGIAGLEVTVAETFNGGSPALLYMTSNSSYIDFSADL